MRISANNLHLMAPLVKNDSMADVDVLCQDEHGGVHLTEGWPLAGFIVPLIELSAAREAICVTCLELHAQNI